VSDKTEFDPRFDPAFQPGYDASAPTAPPKAKRSANPAEAALRSATAGERAIYVEGAQATGRNPFVIALVAIGVVLIIAGGAVIRSLGAAFDSVDIRVDLDYYTLDVLKVVGPMLIALGSATIIGVVFVKAVQWKGRAESD
jgi:hypothetical protein